MSVISGKAPTSFSIIKLRDYYEVVQYIGGISLIGTAWRAEVRRVFERCREILTLEDGVTVFLMGSVFVVALAALLIMILRWILSCIIGLGYARFYLNLTGSGESSFETLFSYFPHWKIAAAAQLLQSLYIMLWSLLFLVPGIMAVYSYAMTKYILAENPEMTAKEAIARSKAMMAGNRWRLFCMQFSFIGWEILCILTLGIGNFVLVPYEEAATAAFYWDLCDRTAPQSENEWCNSIH